MRHWSAMLILVGGVWLLALGLTQWWGAGRALGARARRWLYGSGWPVVLTDRRTRRALRLTAAGSGLSGLAFTLYGGGLLLGWLDGPLVAVVLPLQLLGLGCYLWAWKWKDAEPGPRGE